MEQQASQQPGMKASSASPQQQPQTQPQQQQQQHVQYAVAHGQPAAFQSPAVAQHPGGAAGYPAAPVSMTQAMAYPHRHHQLQLFWKTQMQEIERVTDFKNHQLPLARIKKIMKADEDVRMISAEAPVVFAKACEMFILELTLRSWINTEENKRRTLQKNDIGAAISCTDIYDFLVDIVPRDELKDEGAGVALSSLPVGAPADAFPYGGMYYMPPTSVTPAAGAPGMIPAPGITVGRPAMPVDPALYASQQLPGMPYMTHQPPQHLLQQQQQQQQQELLPETSGNPLDSSQAKDGE